MKRIFKKAFATLIELMTNLNQQAMLSMISNRYAEVNVENATKLLVRCKHLLMARRCVYKTLKNLVFFERVVKEIRKNVDQYLESPSRSLGQKIEVHCVGNDRSLVEVSQTILKEICELKQTYKLFAGMQAVSSKGYRVQDKMTFKRRDAERYIVKEYLAIKRLVQVICSDGEESHGG